ncbi:UNVERIFIED_CONTAM: hypothetical protein FKN15_032346 [Acipenser sinensis]
MLALTSVQHRASSASVLMHKVRPMSGSHPCTACNANIPQEDEHTHYVRCLGVLHATMTLERDGAYSVCEAFQPRLAGPSAALGAPDDLSQDSLLDIPNVQAAHSRSPSPQARQLCSKQARNIMDLKAQMAQVLELLAKQAPAAQARSGSAAAPISIPPPPPRECRGSQYHPVVQLGLGTRGMCCSFPAGPLDTSGRTSPRPQMFPAFPDFMEEVRSSWDCPASGPSVLKQAAPLASLEGLDKLGLAGFCPVDSTIAALVKAPPVGGLARDLAARTLNAG